MYSIINGNGIIVNKRCIVPGIYVAIDKAYRADKAVIIKNIKLPDGYASPAFVLIVPQRKKYMISFNGYTLVIDANDVITPASNNDKQTTKKEEKNNES